MADLKNGVSLSIHILPTDEDEETYLAFSSEAVMLMSGGRLLINAPRLHEAHYPMEPGRHICVYFTDNDIPMRFEAEILRKIDKIRRSYLLIKRTSDFSTNRRRKYHRHECLFDGYIRYNDTEHGGIKKAEIIAVNISEGGASIWSPVGLDSGKALEIRLNSGADTEPLHLACRVRHCVRNSNRVWTMRYNLGIQFVFDNDAQKRILSSLIRSLAYGNS